MEEPRERRGRPKPRVNRRQQWLRQVACHQHRMQLSLGRVRGLQLQGPLTSKGLLYQLLHQGRHLLLPVRAQQVLQLRKQHHQHRVIPRPRRYQQIQ
jgi:hypothetical protein